MERDSTQGRAVELLQDLGLKQYEARCLVALTRVPEATAREVSELADVPRTRVYDAVESLEGRGLVEIQQSNPQRFRAVDIEETAETLRRRFNDRLVELVETVQSLEPGHREEGDAEGVWTLTGRAAISNRVQRSIESAEEEVVLVVGSDDAITDEELDALASATDRDVLVVVGTLSADLTERIQSTVPDVEVFESWLEWLETGELGEENIERVLIVDRDTLLISSIDDTGAAPTETAVWATGTGNGLVPIARRLLATGIEDIDRD